VLTAGGRPDTLLAMTPPGPTRTSSSDADDEALTRRAVEALEHAYSPYSKVRVGAALLAEDGRIFTGCNVENASLGLTACAERNAVVKAISEGARTFKTIVIATDQQRPLMPCGACRQVLFEFAPYLRLLVVGTSGRRYETFLEDLLPEAFGPADLG
jgi:cytidine deaminase